MYRLTLFACLVIASLCLCASAQTNSANPSPKQVTAVGLHLAPISDLQYGQASSRRLKRGQGLAIEKVLPNSPAARADLKVNDLLVAYDGQDIVDSSHFVKLVHAIKPERKVPLVLLRDGRELTLEVNLLPGSVTDVANQLKGQIKPGGPPEVIVETVPLDSGKLRITFTYYPEGQSKLDSVTCIGTLTEIETEVRKVAGARNMPQAVRDLVDVALKRLRKLDSR